MHSYTVKTAKHHVQTLVPKQLKVLNSTTQCYFEPVSDKTTIYRFTNVNAYHPESGHEIEFAISTVEVGVIAELDIDSKQIVIFPFVSYRDQDDFVRVFPEAITEAILKVNNLQSEYRFDAPEFFAEYNQLIAQVQEFLDKQDVTIEDLPFFNQQ
jgi:hypothetical protein